MKRPKNLHHVWQEWEQGVNGGKAAKLWTHAERGTNTSTYSDRKKLCTAIDYLVKRGHSADNAIDMLYKKYGEGASVNGILKGLEADKGASIMSPVKPGGLKRM
jgi:hypothetical protein